MSVAVLLYRHRLALLALLALGALCVLVVRSPPGPAGASPEPLARATGPPSATPDRQTGPQPWVPPPVPPLAPAAGDAGRSLAEQKVRRFIGRSRVMVFSKTYCPYSRRAKELLAQYRSERGLQFDVLEADLEADPAAVKAALAAISGQSTFPNVFVDGLSVGGSDDLARMHASGELAALFLERRLIA
ncbi:hypothetical protein H4R18_003236 [Coemansia javaensis]|uniref:Glutaredoxin domain-containing protein n=1 Tax=Coemansia javaensis TaxID=2761396 RepID=A0A9W8H7J7_9FUNG|nr:hypothetical protein H4R18_003236 [Coemansia javaensis]